MSLTLQADPLPLRVESDGGIRVGNTRIHLEIVIGAFDNGASPESIVRAYDTLTLADVYAVVTYYLRHKDEVKAYIKRRDEEAEELRRKIEATQPPLSPNFWDVLRARRARQENGDASLGHG